MEAFGDTQRQDQGSTTGKNRVFHDINEIFHLASGPRAARAVCAIFIRFHGVASVFLKPAGHNGNRSPKEEKGQGDPAQPRRPVDGLGVGGGKQKSHRLAGFGLQHLHEGDALAAQGQVRGRDFLGLLQFGPLFPGRGIFVIKARGLPGCAGVVPWR